MLYKGKRAAARHAATDFKARADGVVQQFIHGQRDGPDGALSVEH